LLLLSSSSKFTQKQQETQSFFKKFLQQRVDKIPNVLFLLAQSAIEIYHCSGGATLFDKKLVILEKKD
jgi:hypothetical protein